MDKTTVTIDKETLYQLRKYKVNNRFKSIDAVILHLLKETEKYESNSSVRK